MTSLTKKRGSKRIYYISPLLYLVSPESYRIEAEKDASCRGETGTVVRVNGGLAVRGGGCVPVSDRATPTGRGWWKVYFKVE